MTNQKVDTYLAEGCGRCSYWRTPKCKVHSWAEPLEKLRIILLDTELAEDLKWKQPCYTLNGNNVLIMSAFKEFCSLNFFKGALLKDAHNLLVAPGENSQAMRQLRFTDAQQVAEQEAVIREYIKQAIEIEKQGLKVEFKEKKELELPEELEQRLAEDAKLKVAFEALTPGRQRGYVLFFSQPKQSQTRHTRIEKCTPQILQGKGLHDR
ncbi:MAG: hypothetical protein GC178_00695 [Flavobacteriales bacterium]|nr:hypothetical protein [Flavobacteriales bacterium]